MLLPMIPHLPQDKRFAMDLLRNLLKKLLKDDFSHPCPLAKKNGKSPDSVFEHGHLNFGFRIR